MEQIIKLIVLGLCMGGIYALVAVGYVVVYKSTKVFNFAQAAMITVGAYALYQALILWSLPIWAAVLFTLAVGAAVGLLVERLLMRPLIGQPILAPIVVTLGLMLLLRGVILMIFGGQVYGYGEHFLPLGAWHVGFVTLPMIQVYAFIISMVAIFALIQFYNRTRMGLGMRVTHEDHVVAQNLGINVKRVFQYSWVIACVLGVISGMLLGNIQGCCVELDVTGLMAIAAILFGGLESIGGAIVGGLTLGVLQMLTIGYLAPLMPGEPIMMVPFAFMLLILIFKPYGLFGLVRIERL